MWHGNFDATLSPKDYDETLKQWTNVFGVPITPTKSQKDTPEKNYQTDNFGPDVQGI
jgi:acetylxylan esterase